jgi:hypothetical protein
VASNASPSPASAAWGDVHYQALQARLQSLDRLGLIGGVEPAAVFTNTAIAWAVFELTRPMASARVVAVRMASWPALFFRSMASATAAGRPTWMFTRGALPPVERAACRVARVCGSFAWAMQ